MSKVLNQLIPSFEDANSQNSETLQRMPDFYVTDACTHCGACEYSCNLLGVGIIKIVGKRPI